MIKINGQCISSMAEFRSFFDADAMGRIGARIANDADIFSSDTEYGSVRHLLRALAKDDGPRPVLRKVDTRMMLSLEGTGEVLLIYNIPPKEGEIDRQNARKLLVGEIAAAEVELDEGIDETLHTDAGTEHHFQGMNPDRDNQNQNQNRNQDRNQDRKHDNDATGGKPKQGGDLHIVRLRNKSVLGDSKVDIGGYHTYAIPPGATAYFLKCGESFINKIPQFSVSTGGYACLMKFGPDDKVTVVCSDARGLVMTEKNFKAEALQQVCADRAGGFVALIDGKILPYSREVQPDDIFDMYLPEDERVVMIRVAGHQIVALTDKKHVYSNYDVEADPKRPVLWIGQKADGSVTYIYEDSYSFPGDVDTVNSSRGKYIYDNGELKNA